jgi:hypothetical protein
MAAKRYTAFNTSTKRLETKLSIVTSAGAGNDGDLVALDANGKIDVSVLPTGVGAETISATAGEILAAGNFVYLNGSGQVMKADGPTGKPATGFVIAGFASAATATVYMISQTNTGVTGLTAGTQYYLGTGGATTATPDVATANAVVQLIGTANSTTSIVFQGEVITYIG